VFSKSGINGASIKEIAQAAGVSQGAMYNHYASKEELAWALFSRSWAEIGVELRRRARENKTLRQQLRAAVRYVFDLYARDPELVTFVYFSRHEHLRRVPASLPNPYMVFRLIIAEAMARGEIPHQSRQAIQQGGLAELIRDDEPSLSPANGADEHHCDRRD